MDAEGKSMLRTLSEDVIANTTVRMNLKAESVLFDCCR